MSETFGDGGHNPFEGRPDLEVRKEGAGFFEGAVSHIAESGVAAKTLIDGIRSLKQNLVGRRASK